MLFNTKQSDYLSSIYKKKENSYNKSQATLKAKGRIPFASEYDKENKKAIRSIRNHYHIISEIQKEPNKNTYLITITKSCDLKLVTELVKKLNPLKKEGYEFDYFSIIEPTKMGIPHIHIKLVVDKKKGFNSKLKKIVSSLGVSFKNIKKQEADMNNYLLKVFKDENYKEYISWVNSLGISLKKAVKKSQNIKINKNLKVSLTKYNKFLIPLIKKTNKFVTLANVREDIDFKTRLNRTSKESSLTEDNKFLMPLIKKRKEYITLANARNDIDFKTRLYKIIKEGSLTEYNKFLIPLIKKRKKYITLANAREDIDFKTRLYKMIKEGFPTEYNKFLIPLIKKTNKFVTLANAREDIDFKTRLNKTSKEVSLTEYNKFLIPLIKKTNKFVTLGNVREDIDFKTRLYRTSKEVFPEQIEKKKTEINARVLYSNIKQVSFFIFVLVETDLRNNGPGNLLQKMLNKFSKSLSRVNIVN